MYAKVIPSYDTDKTTDGAGAGSVGRAHVGTRVTGVALVCRRLLADKHNG